MAWTRPTAADFKAFFARDFNFAPASDPSNLSYITDADITRAMDEAELNFNTELFGSDAQTTNAFMYLVAFSMIVNIQNSSKGLSSQSKFPISSNSVGGISIQYQIPEKYAKDPVLSQYTQNGYGMKYLSLVLPLIIGHVVHSEGTTRWD